jgi:peroxiredoxin
MDRASYELGWVAVHRMLREGKSWSGREEDCSYWNTGDGRFANVSAVTGLDLPDDGRAAARVDWDLDGKTDLVLSERNSPRVRVFVNRAPSKHRSIDLLLRGKTCNRDAIGARVEVELADGGKRIDTLRAGEGYLAQSSKWLHFGLGQDGVAKVRVRWPGSRDFEEFSGVEAGGKFILEQSSGAAKRWSATPIELATKSAEPFASTERARIVLAGQPPLPPLPILTSEGQPADVQTGIEPPLLVMLWASWCPPCASELTEFARRADEIRAAGLAVLALSVDEEPKRPQAFEFLTRLQWDFHAGFASVEAIEALDGLQRSVLDRKRRMPVPTSFLVDRERKIAVIYKGPVDVATLLADVARLGARPEERHLRAAAFPGKWLSETPEPDLGALEFAYVERGLEAASADVSKRRIVSKSRSRAGLVNDMGKVRAQQGKLDEALANFAEAVQIEPGFVEARLNFAYALHQSGRVAEAVPEYERVLQADSRNVVAAFNLALARCALGQRDRARTEIELVRVLDASRAGELERQIAQYFSK